MTTTTTTIMDHQLPSDTHNLYDITFFESTISTTVTNTSTIVDEWISTTELIHHSTTTTLHNNNLIVGLDVEWRPCFIKNSENPIATLQLCVGRRCLIFQILHSPIIPGSLANFLGNPSYTFVGVGINEDVVKLHRNYYLAVNMIADLRGLAERYYGQRELRNCGLKDLTKRVLGKVMVKPKNITMSRWDDRWLTPAQVQYACLDAYLSYEIGRILIIGAGLI